MAFRFPHGLEPLAAARALAGAAGRGVGAVAQNWRRIAALGAVALGLMVFGYVSIRFVINRIPIADKARHYAEAVVNNSFDWLDRAVRGEAAVKAQAAAWKPLPSELQDLELNLIALQPRPVRSAAMTQLAGGKLLAVTAHGAFIALNPDTAAFAKAEIASPLNLEEFRADPLWRTPGMERLFFRINDILALRRGRTDTYDFYATHYHFTKTCIEFHLSRSTIVVEGERVRQTEGWKRLFVATPCFPVMQEYSAIYIPFSGNLSGGRMLDYDDKHLLMTVGDQQVFEARGVDVAQDDAATMGKILLIDKDTGAHAPFAKGTRNGQGLMRDSRGRIWETEHGPHGGDELNLVRPGDNLGWPKVTYGVNYDQRPWPGAAVEGRHDGFRPPVHAWMPSVGISNLVEAPAAMFPNWAGDLLVGSLSGNTLFRVRLEGDEVIYAEPIRFGGHSLRDIEVLPDGRIAMLDSRMSMLLLRNAAGPGASLLYNAEARVAPKVTLAGLSARRAGHVAEGALLYGRRCAECHSLRGAAAAGPALRNVAGRRIGAQEGYAYSEALSRAGGVWSEGALTRYLLAPESFGATVAMPNPGLTKAEAASLAAYLVELQRQDRRDRRRAPAVLAGADTRPGGGAN